MKTINFNRPKLQRLKDAYDRAKATGRDQFNFEGNRILTAYAKYLIEYLEIQFKEKAVANTSHYHLTSLP
jgi:hypothetical protein